jgi:valyl-tRNA synthetase
MKTEMEKNYDPSQYEDYIYNKWENSGYFNPDNLNLPEDAPGYSIVMPPPNVTGHLHMGHASMLAYQDNLIRFYRMRGYRTVWIPGTDHAAIATQAKVEKKILEEEGLTRHDLGREKFLQRVEQFASDSHDNIVNQVRKMGSSCDWSREAYTLDEIRTKTVRLIFKAMYEDGLIYQGERIVNWCPGCHSTLSDDEVEYHSQQAKLYTFKYSHDFPIEIATTRPETKLGDTAVAVHPDDERYKDYIGQTFKVEFLGIPLNIKVIADKTIDSDFGTGALGVTPAHSQADWELAEKHGLEMTRVIDKDGRIREGFGEFSDLTTEEAKKAIAEKLESFGLLKKEEDLENNISACYRCDTPIEPIPSVQWFLGVNRQIPKLGRSIKELCQEAVKKGVFGRDKIRIIPERFEKHYFHWIDNLRDWCISRQIWYGHRVPVWYRGEEKYAGVEEPSEDGWEQDKDTLDTWFSSGLWTFSTMASRPEDVKFKDGKIVIDNEDFKHFHPTGVLETGYDILFFWVARMIIMTTYAVEDIPFYDVYLQGLIRDGQGKKMSKSKGNVLDPLEVIQKHGADAVRLSLLIGSTPGQDLCLGDEKVAGFQKFVNKLWNISRFILSKADPDATGDLKDFSSKDLTLADKWILKKFNELVEGVTEDLKRYRFSRAGEKLKHYTWEELADWYLEITKFEDKGPKNEILLYILNNLLKMWHPFIPFVTETIWQKYNDSLLISENWAESAIILNKEDEGQAEEFEAVRSVIGAIRNVRAENNIEPGKKLDVVIGAGEHINVLQDNRILIENMRTGVKELQIEKEAEKQSDAVYVAAGEMEIYLLGAVDKDKEQERMNKEVTELEKWKENIEQRLNNKEFVNKAPEQVVNKEKEKLEEINTELSNLKSRLENLG